jgi:hypothetical protein
MKEYTFIFDVKSLSIAVSASINSRKRAYGLAVPMCLMQTIAGKE